MVIGCVHSHEELRVIHENFVYVTCADVHLSAQANVFSAFVMLLSG